MAGVNFLYYCSLQDVKDNLLNYDTATANRKLIDKILRKAISKAYGELNAALKQGGYTVPVMNSVKTLMDDAEVASTAPVVIGVADAGDFSIGDVVRIHGLLTSSTLYEDEFTSIVLIASNNITVEFLEDSYDASATMELCTQGFLYLRSCLADGAAFYAARNLQAKGSELKDSIEDMGENFRKCLDDLKERKVSLDGLTLESGSVFISTWASDNSEQTDADPIITMDKDF